jgi:hypothetical protein
VGWMEFVAEMTKALAWPIAVVIAVALFRRQLVGWMTERPSRIKAGPFEAEWAVTAAATADELEKALPAEPEAGPAESPTPAPTEAEPADEHEEDLDDGAGRAVPIPTDVHARSHVPRPWGDPILAKIGRLAYSEPVEAVDQAAQMLGHRLRRALQEAGGTPVVWKRGGVIGELSALTRQAQAHRVITDATASSLLSLAKMRNLASHGEALLDTAQAIEFLRLADIALAAIKADVRSYYVEGRRSSFAPE